jgi:hypothetical protein
MPRDVSAFDNPLDIFLSIDAELNHVPEYYYSYGEEEESFACPYGGSFTFGPGDTGLAYSFEKCAFTEGFEITGTGGFNDETSVVTFETQISGDETGNLDFSYDWTNGHTTLNGNYAGQEINIDQ